MSYRYRKQKRILAHNLLNELADQFELAEKTKTKSHYLNIYESETLKVYIEKGDGIAISVYAMLIQSEYIARNRGRDDATMCRITNKGIDAYFESHYLRENGKDRLESIELYTKWIIPIGSFIISVIALLISIAKK